MSWKKAMFLASVRPTSGGNSRAPSWTAVTFLVLAIAGCSSQPGIPVPAEPIGYRPSPDAASVRTHSAGVGQLPSQRIAPSLAHRRANDGVAMESLPELPPGPGDRWQERPIEPATPTYRAPPAAAVPPAHWDQPAHQEGGYRPDFADADPARHIEVKVGDTLFSIARRHNVSVQALMEANQLTDTQIALGQRLQLPPMDRY